MLFTMHVTVNNAMLSLKLRKAGITRGAGTFSWMGGAKKKVLFPPHRGGQNLLLPPLLGGGGGKILFSPPLWGGGGAKNVVAPPDGGGKSDGANNFVCPQKYVLPPPYQ